jgi:hypothetical protein
MLCQIALDGIDPGLGALLILVGCAAADANPTDLHIVCGYDLEGPGKRDDAGATDNRRVSLSRQWAPEEDNQLRSLIVAGERPAEIAIRLRGSIVAVYARAHRFRLSFKRVQQRPR